MRARMSKANRKKNNSNVAIEKPQRGPAAEAAQRVLLNAINHFGSETALGKAIGYSQNAVWRAKRLRRISPRMAVKIEVATKGKFKKSAMCPEVFGTARTVMSRRWNGQAAAQ